MIGNQTLGPTTFGQRNIVDPSVPVVASAASISPTSHLTRMTGTVAIDTIVQPDAYFVGPLYLYNTDSSSNTWSASGNIAVAGTFTRYVVIGFFYDTATSKWYPTAVA